MRTRSVTRGWFATGRRGGGVEAPLRRRAVASVEATTPQRRRSEAEMPPPPPRAGACGHHPRERGIALLLVIWVFMILGVLALDFAQYMPDDAMAAVNLAEEARGYYLALAGMNRSLFDAQQAFEHSNPGSGGTAPPHDDDQDA